MELTVITTLVDLIVGALVGACIGMAGIGGGVLILPVLTLGFGMPSTVAVGTAHLYAFLCKLPAVFFHYRQGTIRFRTSMYFLSGAVPATVAVAYWISGFASAMEADAQTWITFQTNLRKFIAGVVIFAGILTLGHMLMRRGSRKQALGAPVQLTAALKILMALTGAAIGGLVASTSVGSGILIVPFMIIILGLPAVETVGSSIFIALVLTFTSTIIYAGGSQMDVTTSLIMAAGSLVGVPIGVRLSRKVRERQLQITIIGLVLMAGVIMLVGG